MSDTNDIYTRNKLPPSTPEEYEAFFAAVEKSAREVAKARGLGEEGTSMLVKEYLDRAANPHDAYKRSVADGHMQDVPDGSPVSGAVPP